MDARAWHREGIEETLRSLGTGPQGLSQGEASKRLLESGPNEVRGEKRVSPLGIFLRQFKNALVIILLAAVVASALIGGVLDAAVIAVIIVFVALMGFVQEYRAERAIESLKTMAAPRAKVLRDGRKVEIPAREVVVGDIILLDSGDRVPADARLIEIVEMEVDEAPLTGESTPVRKDVGALLEEVGVAERRDMVFTATTVTYGRGVAVVTAVGMATEFGRIAAALQEVEPSPTPLEARLSYVGRWLGLAAILIVAFVSLIQIAVRGRPPLEMVIWGIALAVAAVPEALPAVVTGTLAIGVQRMSKRNAIVRKLPAVEALGAVTVICSDKTGTLTRNEMMVREIYLAGRFVRVSGEGFRPEGAFQGEAGAVKAEGDLAHLLRIGALCSNARLVKEGGWRIDGDPTEGALLVAAAKGGLWKEELEGKLPRVGEFPFSSERMRMSTLHEVDGSRLLCLKGAPEVVLGLSAAFLKEGEEISLTEGMREEILEANRTMASKGLRVLALAYRRVAGTGGLGREEMEKDLVFAGMEGMIDAPRGEVKEAIGRCERAGIKTVMITGDHRATAEAVARELGILKGGSILTGAELDGLDDGAFEGMVEGVRVYARVSPFHKIRIIKALKKSGHVVAMTGDGVNDAPALKIADVGIAMGITGTDVAKEASDMVLADDNFVSIVAAVEEGRGIYDNIRKYLAFLLSCNLGEILAMFAAALLNWPIPLLAIHLLYVNLATDGLPALALGIDPAAPDIMERPPRSPRDGVFHRMKGFIVLLTVFLALGILAIFYWSLGRDGLEEARTMAFAALILMELFNAYNCRSITHSLAKIGPLSNRWLNLAVIWEFLLLNAILFIPFFNPLFHTVPIAWTGYLVIGGAALSVVLVVEAWKRSKFGVGSLGIG
ncbi:MAG: cation-translocating P-type ATPase [Euryarchaeota archaeon]|nr:cation-translocating P-type ATPase [Euryarchaeota archaeon]